MTRETKIGLVVASSFLCLVGVVVASKFNQSKSQADDAAVKAKEIKKDGNAETPPPIPLVASAPGIIDPKIEKAAGTLPLPGGNDNRLSLPAVPGFPTENPPAFPSAPAFKPDSLPPASAPLPTFPAADAKPTLPPIGEIKPLVSLPPAGNIKPPTEAPPLPFASADDDKIKRAMEQLKNEGAKPRFEPSGTLAFADPTPPPTSTPPIPPVPVTPTPPPTLPASPVAPATTPPSAPPVLPTTPGSTPTLPTTPSAPPVLPTTPPAGTTTPPTLPGAPLAPVTPTTPPITSPPVTPAPPAFSPPQDLGKPPVIVPPLVRSPNDPTLPSPFAKPSTDPLAPRPSTAPVISDLPSDKKPPFVGTLADPNKVAPVLSPQPDTRTANGQKYLWQFQDSWENVSNRYFQSPKYAKALAAFNQRPQPVPGDTLLVPDANYLDQRFSQFVSNVGLVTPMAPPVGISPIAPPMGISPIAPPMGIVPTNPSVDLSAPRPSNVVAGGNTSYRVPTGGRFITEVARETLRSEFEWSRIFELNRHLLLNPSQRIPEGTILTIPQPKS